MVRTDQQASDLRGFAQETVRADLLAPASLPPACSGMDAVVSAAGASVHLNIPGRKSFRDLDYQGHRNLLDAARSASVPRFLYVSVVNSPGLRQTAYVRAKEDFSALLAASPIDACIVRPTGFFSAYADLVRMARNGWLPLIGDGSARTNPIDDEDLAGVCVSALASGEREADAGGPDVLTRKQIAGLVFEAVGKPPRYRGAPAWVATAASRAAGLYSPRMRDLIEFYAAVSKYDAVAPVAGSRRLADYIAQLARFS